MEQEVPVVIHSDAPCDQAQEPLRASPIPDQIKEISESISESFSRFKESPSYEQLLDRAEKTREYIRKYPAQAMLYSLGAGALLGLIFRRKR